MIKLRKAGGHLSAAGAGSGDNNKRSGGFDEFVFAEAVFAYDMRNVVRIAFDSVIEEYLYPKSFKLCAECGCRRLTRILRKHNAANVKPVFTESVDKAQNVRIIGDAEVAADFVAFNIACVDDYYNFNVGSNSC